MGSTDSRTDVPQTGRMLYHRRLPGDTDKEELTETPLWIVEDTALIVAINLPSKRITNPNVEARLLRTSSLALRTPVSCSESLCH